jgi:N-acetyl-anhydromuramyl-L-alanine amidase AmpD
MLRIADGMISDARIRKYRYPGLEHGPMREVHGIVLHQTNSSLAFPTLLAYYWRDIGAHFLVSPDGTIYQTARIDRQCHHVGMIKSVCYEIQICSPSDQEQIARILDDSKRSIFERRKALHLHESRKHPAKRFPDNTNSIGIEVVGGTNTNGIYVAPTSAQNSSSTWLTNELLAALGLKKDVVYRHPQISYKNPTEAHSVAY